MLNCLKQQAWLFSQQIILSSLILSFIEVSKIYTLNIYTWRGLSKKSG